VKKFFCVVSFLVGVVSTFGASVTLQWNENAEPDVTQYRIYAVVGNATNFVTLQAPTHTVTFTNATAGWTYEFYATAINAQGLESDWSDGAVWVAPVDPPPVPGAPELPRISYGQTSRAGSQQWSVAVVYEAAARATGYRVQFNCPLTNVVVTTTNLFAQAFLPAMPTSADVWATNAGGLSQQATLLFSKPGRVRNLHAQ
jgi:fibronectin type 3 domain-containing protein